MKAPSIVKVLQMAGVCVHRLDCITREKVTKTLACFIFTGISFLQNILNIITTRFIRHLRQCHDSFLKILWVLCAYFEIIVVFIYLYIAYEKSVDWFGVGQVLKRALRTFCSISFFSLSICDVFSYHPLHNPPPS